MGSYSNSTHRIQGKDLAQKQALGEYALNNRKIDTEMGLDESLDAEVRDMISKNELDNATVIFSKSAIQLFAYMFGNSMESAVKRGLKGLEERMDKKIQESIQNYMVDVLNKSTVAMQEFLDEGMSMVIDKAVDNLTESAIEKVREVESRIPEPTHTPPTTTPDIKLGNSKKTLIEYSPYLLNVFRNQPNTEVKLSEACDSIFSEYNIEWHNVNHTMDYLLETEPNLVRSRRGFYIYKG